jgi:iron complex transport system substrate-binding protein
MKSFVKTLALILALCLLLSGCGAQPVVEPDTPPVSQEPSADTVEIVDMGGRTLTIPAPDKLERIYPTGSTGLILLYTLAPDKMTAAPSQQESAFSEEQKKFLTPEVHDLPSYGTMSGQGSLNLEEIKNADVQVILSMGTGTVSEGDISTAEELQAQLDIPVVCFSGDSADYADAYRLLAKMLGREEDSDRIIAYCEDIIQKVEAVAAQVPEEERTTLYYAEGDDGLATEPATSNRSYVFNTAGARNIAEVEGKSGFGQSAVSMEQVLSWNPEIIITQGTTKAYETILSDPNWTTIEAVKNGRVYRMPDQPYSWADRPPSVNRFIGLHWMANLLYPELYDIDIVDVAIDYYKVMYHVDISRADMEGLLVDSIPQD